MPDLTSRAGDAYDDVPRLDPSRILFVSANMGAGHNATARAVEQAARRLWPHAESRWVDTLEVMGPGVGPTFRQIYVTNVQTTPWLYEFFYSSLWRHRWFASASKRFVGTWCGRRLAPVIEDYEPDLVVSTYPLGSAGLQWLRAHRGLDVPVAAWISDFAPHPFWVYPDLDVHFVMHGACARPASTAEPGASVAVAAPPVSDGFRPGDRAVARERLGLRQDTFIVLLSCGYFGFGTVEKAVDTLLAVDQRIQIVAVCGGNEELRQRVAARDAPSQRLLALGWVDAMSTYVTAADLVVTNAGGATSLEALACGRAVAMFDPIAAHGRANAELMAEAGLALLCRTPAALEESVRGLLEQPERLAALEQRAVDHTESRTREDDLRMALAGDHDRGTPGSGNRMPRLLPLQPEDAFFLYTDTSDVNQVLGGVVYLEGHVDLETARAEIGSRLPGLPNLRRRLVASTSGWRRPSWLFEDRIDPVNHVEERVLGARGEPSTFPALVDDFFSTPLDLGRQPWQLHLVQGLEGGRSGLLVKLHHVLGDGFAAMDSMAGLLEDLQEGPREGERDAHGAGGSGGPGGSGHTTSATEGAQQHGPGERTPARSARQLVQQRTRRVVSGLWNLARAGGAPPSGLNGTMAGGRRRHATVSLPVSDVRATARGLHTGMNVLLLTVVAEGLNRVLDKRGEPTTGSSLRVMVPRTIRTPENRHALGNITAAVPLDLPLGPVSTRSRLAEVQQRVDHNLNGGQPEASRLVVKALGLLPAPVHARVARAIYSSRWFNAIVSMIPGPRTPQTFAGVRLTEVYPILPVADGVGLSIGLMRWAENFSIGLTGDAELVHDVDELAAALRDAFAEFRDAARADGN